MCGNTGVGTDGYQLQFDAELPLLVQCWIRHDSSDLSAIDLDQVPIVIRLNVEIRVERIVATHLHFIVAVDHHLVMLPPFVTHELCIGHREFLSRLIATPIISHFSVRETLP
jgi:hypothetical protein